MADRSFHCPRCGAPLPVDGSPCPRCLMELGQSVDSNVETTALPPEEPPPDLGTIGPYRLLSVLGEGGMGTVYLAEQRQPIQRRVALKLVRSGLAGKDVLARFEAERQALALMAHPGIARVLDAGTTADGSPFFVMEYVHGEPITAWCDRKRLAMEERITLFRQACAAVQHAHQRGILHRDLKPSNLLVEEVDGEPKVRVIDFGLAKALHQRLTERTLFTERGQIVGTPEYMSPEQAAGEAFDVDTTTDVYSLGVVLYELLTGSLPHDPQRLREAGWLGMMKILREEEPKKPSTRVSTLTEETVSEVASKRRTEPRSLTRSLAGDIDWILLKALDKERQRRYANVSDLAADLERHLANEPVAAGPPSASYRARKFVRRNRISIAVALALFLLLLGALIFALERLALVQRQRADLQDRFETERIASAFGFALSARLARAPPTTSSDWRIEQAKIEVASLRRRLEALRLRVKAAALVAAAASLYDHDLGGLAAELLGESLAGLQREPGSPLLLRAQNLHLLALVEKAHAKRVPWLDESLAIYTAELGERHPVSIDVFCLATVERLNLALEEKSGEELAPEKKTEFEQNARRCFELTDSLGQDSERILARRLAHIGFLFRIVTGDRQRAREFLEQAVRLLREQRPVPAWQLAEALEFLSAYAEPSDPTSALEPLREACALRESTAGLDSRDAAICRLNLGAWLLESGSTEEGIECRTKALKILESLDPDSGWSERAPVDEASWFYEFSLEDPYRDDARHAFEQARGWPEGDP